MRPSKPWSAQSFWERSGNLAFACLNRLLPKLRNKVVLHSTNDIEDGILAVLDALGGRGVEAIVLMEDQAKVEVFRRLTTNESVYFVRKHSVRARLHYLTARYVVMTHGLYGSKAPPRSQIVVNLWHGEPPAKIIGRFEGDIGVQSTLAPTLSSVGKAYRAAEFGLDPRSVPVIGAPRNDRMLAADKVRIRDCLFGTSTPSVVFLWMPTFRTLRFRQRVRVDVEGGSSGFPYSASELADLDTWLQANNAIVLLKLHPHDAESVPDVYDAIRILDQSRIDELGVTTYPLLAACDCLITDASSVWLDFLLLDRPMIFAFPDIEQYRAGRGLNIEPYEAWVPGPFVRTIDDLRDEMSRVVSGGDPLRDERSIARVRFHRYLDGSSTDRLLDEIGIPDIATGGGDSAIPAPGLAARSIVATLASTVIAQAAVFGSGIVTARALGVSGRGYFVLFTAVAAITAQLFGFGLPRALTYFIARTPEGAIGILRRVARAITVSSVLGYVATVVTLLIATNDSSTDMTGAVMISAMACPLSVALASEAATLQGLGHFMAFSIVRGAAPVLYTLTLVAAILVTDATLTEIVGLLIATLGATCIGGWLLTRRALAQSRQDPSVEVATLREMASFGGRGLLGANSLIDAYRLDQAVVGLFISPVALGLYSAANAFTNFPRLITESLGLVGYPRIAQSRDSGERRHLAFLLLVAATFVAFTTAVPIYFLAHWLVVTLFGESFAGAAPILRILLGAAILASIRKTLVDISGGSGRPGFGSQSEVVTWVTLLALLPVAISGHGTEGVAWSLVGSSALGVVYLGTRLWHVRQTL